jgi:hypothetical protein
MERDKRETVDGIERVFLKFLLFLVFQNFQFPVILAFHNPSISSTYFPVLPTDPFTVILLFGLG